MFMRLFLPAINTLIMLKKIFFTFILLLICSGFFFYFFSSHFLITPTAQEETTLAPHETFTITFPKDVDARYFHDIIIEPHGDAEVTLKGDRKQLIIKPITAWQPGETYTISLPRARTGTFTPVEPISFSFTVIDHPHVTETLPHDQDVDVIIDIEDPIAIDFDHSTEDFFIDFSLEPNVPLAFQNNKAKTQFELLPEEALAENTTYNLTIHSRAKDAPQSATQKIHQLSFSTPPPVVAVVLSPEERANTRILNAQKTTIAQITDGKYIDINLTDQIMTTFENGRLLNSYLVSSGKVGMNTPIGAHQIYNKHPRPWSSQYGLYMPNWMAITPDGLYGIHELPEWPSGYKEGKDHLGTPVSHGCVRLGVGPSQSVYDWAEIGTPVIVY